MRERWLLILIEGATDQEGMEVMNPPSIHVQGHPTDNAANDSFEKKAKYERRPRRKEQILYHSGR